MNARITAPSLPHHLSTHRLTAVSHAPRHTRELARAITGEPDPITHQLASGRYQTPLRYPGAKSGLAPLIGRLIASASTHSTLRCIDLLVEPFAGGASTSLRLVGDGTVKRILLADADPLVAAFWQVAADQTGALIARIREEHADHVTAAGDRALARWDYWRHWSPRPGTSERVARFEAAVKCLFLNRTTFSGILHGRAGPIGGRSQTSRYNIGCRFNAESISQRIAYVGHLYDTRRLVDVWCMDWRDTLNQVTSVYKTLVPDHVLAYLDPPYLEKSSKLYNTSFDAGGGYARPSVTDLGWHDVLLHERLAAYLNRQMRYRWILSYDNHPSLLNSCLLYARDRMNPDSDAKADGVRTWRISKRLVQLNYTASALRGRGSVDELLLTTLPPSAIPMDADFRPTLHLPHQTPAGVSGCVRRDAV